VPRTARDVVFVDGVRTPFGAALISARDEALAIARFGHAVFRRLGELGVPSFAFVNGAALGGGLELALHCSYRTISSGVTAVAFPECFLGLLPGWGGTYLLPRLIGPTSALKVIVENPLSQNRMLNGAQAQALGIADAMFEPADFLAESLRWAARMLTGAVSVSRERALEALAEEIRLMLDEGVVAAPEDIDLCMILGAGWPFHLGGITPYLDRAGIAEKVTGTRFRV